VKIILGASLAIKTVEEVVKDHVLETVALHPDVPQYRLAVELGWSPSTLCRRLAAWAEEQGEEELVRDRR